MSSPEHNEEWTQVIEPTRSFSRLNLLELWRYRDLIILFVRRDIISVYQQTIMGPLWHIIQPLFATAVFSIFVGLANLGTDNLPRIPFVFCGIVIWNYFSNCLTKASNTFIGNAHIFGKVYFPRLAIPISVIISNLMSLLIQLLLIIPFLIYYKEYVHPTIYLLAIPFIILVIALTALGFGIIVSSLTIKYRDLIFLISFAVQLAMYATPVIYPLSIIPGRFRMLASLNPLTPMIEMFRYAILGRGTFSAESVAYSAVFAIVITSLGIFLFNRVEKSFMDTV